MQIGGVTIESKLALAPMAGVTDLAFRTLCREEGAGLTYTEMVSAKALCFQDKKTIQIMELGESEHPAAVQLFGSDVDCMAQAAGRAGHHRYQHGLSGAQGGRPRRRQRSDAHPGVGGEDRDGGEGRLRQAGDGEDAQGLG